MIANSSAEHSSIRVRFAIVCAVTYDSWQAYPFLHVFKYISIYVHQNEFQEFTIRATEKQKRNHETFLAIVTTQWTTPPSLQVTPFLFSVSLPGSYLATYAGSQCKGWENGGQRSGRRISTFTDVISRYRIPNCVLINTCRSVFTL